MAYTPKQVEYIARAIVNRLEDRSLVEFGDIEAALDVVVRVLTEHVRTAEAILQEAKERAAKASAGREPTQAEIDEEVRKLAAGRNFTI
jgi:hypothetical protein